MTPESVMRIEAWLSDDAPLTSQEFHAAFTESDLNGKPIDWRFWVHQMPSLTAAQAARLMNGMDPDLFASLDDGPNDSDPGPAGTRARDWQRLAEVQGMVSGSPASWLEWADKQLLKDGSKHRGPSLSVHPMFRIEVDKLKARPPQPEPQAETPSEGATGNELDFTLLASREELISAFGKFTGMDMSWFDSLKDSPALLAARRFAGQGGRGHIAPPLFCPYAVMQWLIDPRRKKGRKVLPETAWRLLRSYFPKVYALYEIGDPRND